jgi:hypothetical protein
MISTNFQKCLSSKWFVFLHHLCDFGNRYWLCSSLIFHKKKYQFNILFNAIIKSQHFCLQRQYLNTAQISEPDLLWEISSDIISYERFHWTVHSKGKLLVKECFQTSHSGYFPLLCGKIITDIFRSPFPFCFFFFPRIFFLK